MIEDASLERTAAIVTVRFDADIAAVTRDREGEVVAGSLSDAVQTHDVWTFRRDLARAIPTGCWSKPTRKSEAPRLARSRSLRWRCCPPARRGQPPPLAAAGASRASARTGSAADATAADAARRTRGDSA